MAAGLSRLMAAPCNRRDMQNAPDHACKDEIGGICDLEALCGKSHRLSLEPMRQE